MGRGPCVRTAARQRRETRERRGFHHGYSVPSGRPAVLGHLAVHLFALMAFNELGRTSLWAGIALFAVVPIVLTVFVWPITAGSRQRVRHGHVVQLGEDIFGTCRLLGLHGAALREVARRGRHDAPPVREALGAVLSAAHPGRQHRRGRRSRLPGVQLRPVARRRGREPVDYVGSLEHHERHCRYPQHRHHLRLVSASSSRRIRRRT